MPTFEQKPAVENNLKQQHNVAENNLNDAEKDDISKKHRLNNYSMFSDVKHDLNNYFVNKPQVNIGQYQSGNHYQKTETSTGVKHSEPTAEKIKLQKKVEDSTLRENALQRKENNNQNSSSAPSVVHDVIHSPGQSLDAGSLNFFGQKFHHDFSQVKIHANAKAAESAHAVNALAYTVGQNIVFASNQFNTASDNGRHLLAHELTHTIQQRNAIMPSAGKLDVSSPEDYHERQADKIAHSVTPITTGAAANDSDGIENPDTDIAAGEMRVALLQRVISFTTAPGTFRPHNVIARPDATGFALNSDPGTFEWQPDVTIHGVAADAFADWETAHHQVGKSSSLNVFWGTGANRTHRVRTINGGLPMRDATAAGNTWYSDWRAQAFAANGDVASPIMRDTPNVFIPWDNPVAGRAGTTGSFDYSFGFVSTLSARHIPDGTGAAAFRHLNHVHWNFHVSGTFDTTLPQATRVTLNGGNVNRGNVSSGFDSSNPPMHGGAIINDNFNTVDT